MRSDKQTKESLQSSNKILVRRLLYKDKKLNYLSVWIANFGVVPLLRFVAFLFAPAFFNLADLFVFVTRVLETIKLLLFPHISHLLINRSIFLAIKAPHVKKLILFSVIFTHFAYADSEKIITLPLHHYYKLPFSPHSKYIIANKKHLKVRLLASKKELLIKPRNVQTSDLLIIDRKNHSTLYRFVTPTDGSGIYEPKKKEALAQIDFYLFQAGLNDFECLSLKQNLTCFIEQNTVLPKALQDFLNKKYRVRFYRVDSNLSRFYHLSFELLLIEKNGEEQIKLGLDDIHTSYNSTQSLKDSLGLILHQQNIKISSISKQKVTTSANYPIKFSVGGEVHYETTYLYNSDKQSKTNHWKFMGLQTEIKVYRHNGDILLQYKNSFSRPTDNLNYHSEKQKGVTTIPLGKSVPLFEMSYIQNQSLLRSIPYLKNIPIFQHLFSSISTQYSQKKIVGIITLQEKI